MPDDLPPETACRIAATDPITIVITGKTLDESLWELERQIVARAMTQARGNRALAARICGMRDDTFRKRLVRYNFRPSFTCA